MKKRCLQFAGRILALTIALAALLFAPAAAETLQECHKVTNSYKDTKAKNKSVVRLWHVETVNEKVNSEVNGLAEGWAEELGGDLPAAKNATNQSSRLDG